MNYMRNQGNFFRRFGQVLLLALFLCSSLYSQAGTSSISGTISEAQGNIVAGATVVLTSEQNVRRTATTNESGFYSFTSVQPGTFTIEVEATGFKKSSLTPFQALVDKATTINVTLEVGQVSETVTVNTTGVENIINTQDAKLGANFVSRQILELPLQGRNVSTLLSLQANVTPDGSVAGGRSDQANITLDGVDVNNQQDASAFAPVLRVNPDTVEEFRVTTSNPDATQGRSSGAQISLITKSGTNQFRGALYEYHRNTATTANSYFNNKAGDYVATDANVVNGLNVVGEDRVPRPKLIRNLFGGRLSGPIIKDRLFFFYNYEGMREAKGSSVTRTVPLPSLGQGIVKFRNTAGTLVSLDTTTINGLTSGGLAVVNVNPLALATLTAAAAAYPANDLTTGDGLNTAGYRFNAPAPVNQNGNTARIDWQMTGDGEHSLSLRGNYQQDVSGGVPAFLNTAPTNTWSHPLGLAATYTWLISSNRTNRFSYGMTRIAFSNQGDSDQNAITFRSVLSPALYSRTFNRVNPTHNFTDDFTWVKGDHTMQIGTNIRMVRNKRSNFGAAYDSAVTNFSFYEGAGNSALLPVSEYLTANAQPAIGSAWTTNLGHALTAVWGRLSQYGANFNFGLDGNPIAVGEPVVREWATEEYDFYVQDTWKFRPNITINAGLRYGLSRPVYETQGFQVAPNIPLQDYLQSRITASSNGQNYDVPLIMELAGPKNNAKPFYELDTNNFQPSISLAWSPKFESGFFSNLFGTEGESTIRGGFRIANDYYGQQLAVTFDTANTLGFSTARNIAANAYNVFDCLVPTATCRPAPQYTGPTMAIKTLPGIIAPATLAFPQQQPANFSRRIETSLDTNLQSPINYSWNISYTRELPGKLVVDVSYVGRLARHLLATRDVMTTNNLRDPVSGMTWYEAATILEKQRQAGVPVAQIQSIPFFDNFYTPGTLAAQLGGVAAGLTNTQAVYARVPLSGDWTEIQNRLDNRTGKRLFYQSQYGALTSFGTIGSSDYHGASVSVRQRMRSLTWDLNYTYSKSMDDASGLQTGGTFGSAFILNALRQQDARSVSDFDLTHVVNFNSVWELPIGKGRQFFSDMNGFANAILGGWQLSTISRYNTGYPIYGFFDGSGWQTNWNVRSNGTRITQIDPSPNANSGTGGVPNLFADPTAAYKSYRSPYPGESGDRNQLRYPSYFVIDAGLAKSFELPWSENQKVQFRWEVFNVTNSAQFTGLANTNLGYNPSKGLPASTFANFTGTQGSARVMQFALRYDF
ncbi:MAG: TonB-dependent receptor [Pyrinomonadaceae bacterium]